MEKKTKNVTRRSLLKSVLSFSLYSIIPIQLKAFSFFGEGNFSIFDTNKTLEMKSLIFFQYL